MRLDLSAGIRRVDWRELAGHAIGYGLFILLGLGCGAVVSIAIRLFS